MSCRTSLGNLAAGKQVTVVGRYRGAGAANINVGGLKSKVVFSSARRNNNAACMLWAARSIETLGKSGRNQGRVVSLSRRFGLPCKWTSWLAIPTEERQNYASELNQADMAYYARRLVFVRAEGRGRSAEAGNLKKAFWASTRKAGYEPSNAKYIYEQQQVAYQQELADAYVDAKHRGDAHKMAYFGRRMHAVKRANLLAQAEDRRTQAIEEAKQQRLNTQIEFKQHAMADEVFAGRAGSKRFVQLQQERNALRSSQNYNYNYGYMDDYDLDKAFDAKANIVAYKIEKEKTVAAPDQDKLSQWQNELADLKAKSGNHIDMSAHLEWARQWVSGNNAPFDEAAARKMYLTQDYGQGGDPLIVVKAPADAQQVVAMMPDGSLKQLVYNTANERWEAHFDVPSYSSDGAFDITVTVVAKDGARHTMVLRFTVDTTPPHGTALAQSSSAPGKWRLEVQGDGDTARVSALLPSGQKVQMQHSTQDSRKFVAVVDAPASGANATGSAGQQVTYILTDSAHNRTEITVDLSK